MSRSISIYLNEQELLYENFIEDIKQKFSNIDFLKKIHNKINTKSKIKDDKIKRIEKLLKEKNIDPNILKKIATKYAKKTASEISKKKSIIENAGILKKNFYSSLSEASEEIKKRTTNEKIFLALITLIVVIVINTFLLTLIFIFLSPLYPIEIAASIAAGISAIFVAPLTEETAKYLSVKYDYTGAFFILFNITEFSLYISSYFGMIALPVLIIARLLAVMMHALTTYIQYKMRQNAEEDKEKASLLGLICGIVIHFFWNLSSSIL